MSLRNKKSDDKDDLTSTQRITLFRLGAQFLAKTWAQSLAPMPFSEVINADGRKVIVEVRDASDPRDGSDERQE